MNIIIDKSTLTKEEINYIRSKSKKTVIVEIDLSNLGSDDVVDELIGDFFDTVLFTKKIGL